MTTQATRILFVGDMHLGTRPSRLPPDAGDPDELGPAGAWKRTVEAALEHRAHAVALAGDVVNKRNALFEATAALRPGLERLAAAGVTCLAVAGNHDTQALPGLLRGGAPLRLLGAGGTWEEVVVRGDSGPPVRIVGWSFPDERWERSPLTEPPPDARADLATFGLLHADLDVPTSPYAPVGAAALRNVGYDGWMLGHIHTPGAVPADDRPFYLGSLTGLDPTETGEHGPVLVTVAAGGAIRRERLPLAPLRWERWEIPCPAVVADAESLREHLLEELQSRTLDLGLTRVGALGVRLVLTGATARPADTAAFAEGLELPSVPIEGVTVFVSRIEADLRAPVDLEAIARGDDPPGLLARRILVLEHGPRQREDEVLLGSLLESLRAAEAEAQRLARGLRQAPPDDAALRRAGARAARLLLDRLLASREHPA